MPRASIWEAEQEDLECEASLCYIVDLAKNIDK